MSEEITDLEVQEKDVAKPTVWYLSSAVRNISPAAIWRNTFCSLDKYNLLFGQIQKDDAKPTLYDIFAQLNT